MKEQKMRMAILNNLYESYPRPADKHIIEKKLEGIEGDFNKSMAYLQHSGYVDMVPQAGHSGLSYYHSPTITPKGIDFLEKEESVITVKLHGDTLLELRSIILSAVLQSAASENEKSALKTAITNAPATVVTQVVQSLTAQCLATVPGALQSLQKLLAESGLL